MRTPQHLSRRHSTRAALLLVVLVPAIAWSAPTVHTVTSFTDTGAAGELRTLMNAAAAGDTIIIPPGSIVLTGAADENANASGDLDVTKDLTIVGAGAELTLIDGGGVDRIFDVRPGVTASISGLTMRNGFVDPTDPTLLFFSGGGLINEGDLTLADVIVESNTAQGGGGINNRRGGVVSLSGSTIRDNLSTGVTANGGGILNGGTMTIVSSTISGNTISPPGGSTSGAGIFTTDTLTIVNSTISNNVTETGLGAGIYQPLGVQLSLINVTVANNKTRNDGGGLVALGGKVIMVNSLLTDNEGGSRSSSDCSSTIDIDSLGHNLIHRSGCTLSGVTTGNIVGVNGKVRPLGDNGGPTLTHALRTSSAAIDAGDNAFCPPQDQRGAARITICDIGALEQQ